MKLNVIIMGQNCEKFIGMCLESVKEADNIIYCDGGSTDKTFEKIGEFYAKHLPNKTHEIIKNKYDQEDKGMNGKQRNFYLDYLKKNHMGEWCLVLDADEVLEDFGIDKIKRMVFPRKELMILSPRIHHFIGDLGHEDFTQDKHSVFNRLFKVTEGLFYPLEEHPVLQGKAQYGEITVHIWHLRECLGIFKTQEKHENNWKKSQIHTKDYLKWWQMSMLLGTYPKKPVYYGAIPTPIKKRFGI